MGVKDSPNFLHWEKDGEDKTKKKEKRGEAPLKFDLMDVLQKGRIVRCDALFDWTRLFCCGRHERSARLQQN